MCDLKGKVVVLTGGTDGIGVPVARRFAELDVSLVILARDSGKAEDVRTRLVREMPEVSVRVVRVDLASLASIEEAASAVLAAFPRIDVLVNNAGVMKSRCELSADGFEMNIAVNHLAVAALTLRLLERMLATDAQARIVNVNSAGHAAALRGGGEVSVRFDTWKGDPDYSFSMAYSRSKLTNLIWTYELAERLRGTGVTVNALHPGTVKTRLGRDLSSLITAPFHFLFSTTPEKGAEPIIHLATACEVAGVTGAYFDRFLQARSSARSYDRSNWKRVWDETVAITGLDYPETHDSQPAHFSAAIP